MPSHIEYSEVEKTNKMALKNMEKYNFTHKGNVH